MLGSYEFEALYAIYAKGARTQRAVAAASGLSLGTANATIKALRAFGLVDDSLAPTDAALDALAPFKVDNAALIGIPSAKAQFGKGSTHTTFRKIPCTGCWRSSTDVR